MQIAIRPIEKVNPGPPLAALLPDTRRPMESPMTNRANSTPKPSPARPHPGLQAVLLLVGLAMLSSACAFGEFRPDDPWKRQISLEDRHKEYTDLVRWSKFEMASGYVHSDDREGFLALMPDFDLVRFTDWDAAPWEFEDQEEKNKAVITVTYRGYSMRTPIEVKVTETQTWEREGSGNNWIVRSTFENLDQLVASH